ncbi:MAG: hypothetical protein ACFFD2_14220 [Promethearchaeota archaeon]
MVRKIAECSPKNPTWQARRRERASRRFGYEIRIGNSSVTVI